MKELLRTLVSQDRAVANARTAATVMSRQRVEREAVELYFDRLDELVHPGIGDADRGAGHALGALPR